jgi:hypothetical protein
MNKGIELTDTGYSLANYVFFPNAEGSFLLNTYLSNVAGFFLTKLPFGGTMLGMNFYATLLVSFAALLGYRFFITKTPAWIAFVSQMAAIGLCWCPPVIIYNYLTYLFFLIAAMLIFRGLAGQRPYCLVLAGVFLGLNVFVRNPNILEAGLIICVWYYAAIRRKKIAQAVRETVLCLAGYAGAVIAAGLVMMLHYGAKAPIDMVGSLFRMSASNGDYTLGGMLHSLISAYLHGATWLFYMVICILPGFPFLMIRLSGLFRDKISEARITIIKKIIYCGAIGFLFYALSRIGMYNFKYYQKDSALQWAVIFIIISLLTMMGMLFSQSVDVHWRLIASIGIVIILVTPLGSNNHIWPVINNLFFIAPVTMWHIYRFARYGRRFIGTESTMIPLFPLKAMLLAIMAAVIIQSLGVGIFHVFRDGENGEARKTAVAGNEILRGMRTTRENAANLQELSGFLDTQPAFQGSSLILYGDIPALSYYLNRPSALSNAWPDLDTFSVSQFAMELDGISGWIEMKGDMRPVIIMNARLTERNARSEKKAYLDAFMDKHSYRQVFENAQFVVFM